MAEDPFIKEIKKRVGERAEPGGFYVINTLVDERDITRILGPVSREEVERKRGIYQDLAQHFPKNKEPFRAYECIDEKTYRRV